MTDRTKSGLCSTCREPIYEDQFDGKQLVEDFIYDFEGDLDYIELHHATCRVDLQTRDKKQEDFTRMINDPNVWDIPRYDGKFSI